MTCRLWCCRPWVVENLGAGTRKGILYGDPHRFRTPDIGPSILTLVTPRLSATRAPVIKH